MNMKGCEVVDEKTHEMIAVAAAYSAGCIPAWKITSLVPGRLA